MENRLFSRVLYNKYLKANKLIGVAYYPSKKKGFQLLLIIKSKIKIDFVKYDYIAYNKILNVAKNYGTDVNSVILSLKKIYIPLENIKGYIYEPTSNGFKTYLQILNDENKIENRFISKYEKKGLNLLDDNNLTSIMYKDILESEGFKQNSKETVEECNDEFKKLKLGVNDRTYKFLKI